MTAFGCGTARPLASLRDRLRLKDAYIPSGLADPSVSNSERFYSVAPHFTFNSNQSQMKHFQYLLTIISLAGALNIQSLQAQLQGPADNGYPVSEIPDSLKKDANAVIRFQKDEFIISNPGKASMKVTQGCHIIQ